MLKLPLYLKATVILLLLFMLFTAMYLLRPLLVPICLAALISILLVPVSERLQKWRVPKTIAIIICIFGVFLILAGIVYLLTAQVRVFINDLPELTEKVNDKLLQIQSFIQDKTHMKPEAQIAWIRERLSSWLNSSGSVIEGMLSATTATIGNLVLIPVYIFFFLFYRKKFNHFLLKITPSDKHYKLQNMLDDIKDIVQDYLTGVFIVVGILAVLNTTDLMLLGIKYALFLGILAAFLNIIPYIGVLIGNLLATLVAFLTKDSLWYPLAVLLSFWGIQILENNLLTPKITGSKVKINPLATILALIIGGTMWGVAGMVLFIPFIGILKVVFDNIPELEPYGYLLGSEDENENKKKPQLVAFIMKKKKRED